MFIQWVQAFFFLEIFQQCLQKFQQHFFHFPRQFIWILTYWTFLRQLLWEVFGQTLQEFAISRLHVFLKFFLWLHRQLLWKIVRYCLFDFIRCFFWEFIQQCDLFFRNFFKNSFGIFSEKILADDLAIFFGNSYGSSIDNFFANSFRQFLREIFWILL